jgi:hypothetical protein
MAHKTGQIVSRESSTWPRGWGGIEVGLANGATKGDAKITHLTQPSLALGALPVQTLTALPAQAAARHSCRLSTST